MTPEQIWIEVVGYVGMAFVLVSFLMTKIIWLRILNLIGAICCCIYGFITKTYPTAILNSALIAINAAMPIRWLIVNKIRKKKETTQEGAQKETPSESEEPSPER